MGVSLDGFIAGENRGPKNPLGDHGLSIHEWMFRQDFFLKKLKIPGTGEMGKDNDIVSAIFYRAGAYIMGKNMFEEGEANWPEDAPFHNPVYVLTHTPREPWERTGGTTFYFVTDGIETALELAKASAGEKDIRISGGAETIRQYLDAGLIDDFTLHIAPFLLGKGLRLFEDLDIEKINVEPSETIHSPLVSHLRYNCLKMIAK